MTWQWRMTSSAARFTRDFPARVPCHAPPFPVELSWPWSGSLHACFGVYGIASANEHVLFERAYGKRDAERNESPLTPDNTG